MGKHKKHKKNKDENYQVDEEFMEELFSDLKEKAQKRRVIIRKPTDEIVVDMPLIASGCLLTATSILFFPVVIIAFIAGFYAKLRLDIITELTDEEARMLEEMEQQQNTLYGIQYESGDGQATLIQ